MITFFLRDYVDCCCSVSCAACSMLFAYCKYEHWLAKKLNPYVVAYQSDHNLENLKQGLDRWRPWALSKHSKTSLQQTGSPLCWNNSAGQKQKKLWSSFASSKNTQDKIGYHLLRGDYARAIGDTKLEEQERLLSEQLKTQLGNKRENQEYPQAPKRVNMLSFAGSLSALVWHCSESSAISPPGTQYSGQLEPDFYFGLVLVPSLLDLADSLVDPAQKGGC